MDTETAENPGAVSAFVSIAQSVTVIYLVPLLSMLVAIDVFEVWPGSDRPFNKNVTALIHWSQYAMAYSILGTLLLLPLLAIAISKKARFQLTFFLLLMVLAAPVVTTYLRLYDAFGVGV